MFKVCFRCNEEKVIEEFYVHPNTKDGYFGKCKECTKKDVKKHRKDNIQKVRAFDRERACLPHRKKMYRKI